MKTISRYIMTLALLLTAVTGAWAGEEPQLLTKIYASSSFLTGSQTFDDIATVTFGGTGTIAFNNGWIQNEYNKEATVAVTAVDGYTITSIKLYDVDSNNATISTSPFTAYLNKWGATYVTTGSGGAGDYVGDQVAKIEVYGYKSEPAEPAIDVKWDPATKTGTFTMPAFGVEIDPIYAPTAVFATDGNQVLTPTAIEGIFAGTTDALVKAGTVAMMGKTENPQGIVMYAVTSINQATAPELSAFSADVPTAENIADEGADVLVWYYIQGANTPDGQEATEENTFNDSEIFAEPIKVTVLPNKYDIQFNAANDNTIEAGRATVTVGGTAATVTEGKLQGVKMGSEVKVKAKPGYKFRKVEAKKGAAGKTITIGDMELTYADGDTWEAIVSKNSDKIKTIAGGYIVQVAQPEPNKYRYIKVVLSNKVNPSDIIDPSKNYEWGTIEVYS